MKPVIVYTAPTNLNPNRAIVSIPDEVQIDSSVSTITINQEQETAIQQNSFLGNYSDNPQLVTQVPVGEDFYLPAKKSAKVGLFGNVIPKGPQLTLDANRSVLETTLAPGAVLSGILDNPTIPIISPLEIKTVQIPPGYVALEDLSALENYAYNRASDITKKEFKLLPGVNKVQQSDIQYRLEFRQGKIDVYGSPFVDSVRVDWRQLDRSDRQIDWTTLGLISVADSDGFKEVLDWTKSGKFVIRAIPYHRGYPLPGFKQFNYEFYKKTETLYWTSMQISDSEYRLLLQGELNQKYNYVVIKQNGKALLSSEVVINPLGRVFQELIVSGVKNQEKPILEIEWYDKLPSGLAYYTKEKIRLYPNFATEDISLSVTKDLTKEVFEMTISDPRGRMYNPATEIDAFTGNQWFNRAIIEKKMMVYLEIKRHQNGKVTNYGHFCTNISQGNNPRFLKDSTFEFVRKSNGGFAFKWMDSAEFRQANGINAPDLRKDLSYEFRLVYWTAGIEQCLNIEDKYFYRQTKSFRLPDGAIGNHHYSYSPWTLEHPRFLYTRVHPNNPSSKRSEHIFYGRSKNGILISSNPIVQERTNNFEVHKLGWQVLYYIDQQSDNVKEFPYYAFNIVVPATTLDNVQLINVYMSTGEKTLIGSYHPAEKINVVDFVGYFLNQKVTAQKLDTPKLIKRVTDQISAENLSIVQSSTISLSSVPLANRPLESRRVVVADKNAMASVGNALTELISGLDITYEVEMIYFGDPPQKQSFNANTSDIPRIPKEPEGNQSFVSGNQFIDPKAMDIPAEFSYNVIAAINEVVLDTVSPPENVVLVNSSGGNFGVFRS